MTGKEGWLGWQDSNLRMAVPKTAALPLGYTPAGAALYSALFPNVKGALQKLQSSFLPSKSAAE